MTRVSDSPADLAQQPTLADFLVAPLEQVWKVAPITMLLGTGGTRRRAVLAGLSTQSEEYARWTQQQMMDCYELIFEHGIQHLLTTIFVSSHNNETTKGYREKLAGWAAWALGGAEALALYARRGWRVRLIGAESWPQLLPTAAHLRQATSTHSGPTLWYSVATRPEETWQQMLKVAIEQGITDRAELIKAFYGEPIPPATLYLGSGKPQVEDSQIPPLLVGKLECYWRQHLGYDLDATTLRTILYDYAYIRPGRDSDKTGRAEQVVHYAQSWENPPVIGLGRRLGPFWYPAPLSPISELIPDLTFGDAE